MRVHAMSDMHAASWHGSYVSVDKRSFVYRQKVSQSANKKLHQGLTVVAHNTLVLPPNGV